MQQENLDSYIRGNQRSLTDHRLMLTRKPSHDKSSASCLSAHPRRAAQDNFQWLSILKPRCYLIRKREEIRLGAELNALAIYRDDVLSSILLIGLGAETSPTSLTCMMGTVRASRSTV